MRCICWFFALIAASACKTPSSTSRLRAAADDTSPSTIDGDCHGKTVLVVTSESAVITLAGGLKYPTGYFLRELSDPLIALVRAGCLLQFATPTGLSPVVDSNSLELLWAYYPYPELKANAATYRAAAMQMATTIYGKLRFSVEDDRWQRISPEVQNYVRTTQKAQSGLTEIAPRSLATIADELEQADAAGSPSPYIGMMVPGGHVPMEDLKVSPTLGRVLNYFHKHLLPTALVCHAPVALLSTTQTEERTFTYKGYRVAVADRVSEQLLEQMGPLQNYHVTSYVDDDLDAGGAVLDQNPWPGFPTPLRPDF